MRCRQKSSEYTWGDAIEAQIIKQFKVESVTGKLVGLWKQQKKIKYIYYALHILNLVVSNFVKYIVDIR